MTKVPSCNARNPDSQANGAQRAGAPWAAGTQRWKNR
jgi:hypothetical protein